MAEENKQQQVQGGQQVQQVGMQPPPVTVEKSKNPLEVPVIGDQPRKVTGGTAKELLQTAQIGQEDVVTIRSPRKAAGSEFTVAELVNRFGQTQGEFNTMMQNIVSAEVKTKKLINAKGEIARDQYNPDDANYELQKMRPAERIAFLNELYKRDMFPTDKGPSATGLDSRSVTAMEQFLMLVNSTGYTMDVAKPMVFATYDPVQGLPGTGVAPRKYQVSAPADIRVVADRVAEEIIGRRLTQAQAQQIIKRVQAAERKAGMDTGTEQVQAPQAQTIAQQQIEQRFGAEAQSMRMGEAIRIHEQLMRSM